MEMKQKDSSPKDEIRIKEETRPLIEPLDEIVFKNRNKEYGAYFLRKIYKKHVNIALAISTTVLLIAVTAPLIAGYLNKKRIVIEEKTVGAEMANLNKPVDEAPPPPPPPPPAALLQEVQFRAPIVVSDSTDESSSFVQDEMNLQSTNTTVDTTFEVLDTKETEVIQEVEEEPYTFVEESSGFPGGEEARAIFFRDNTVYPPIAKENGIQGKVYVQFIVKADGTITRPEVVISVAAPLDEEALRVVRMMPKWTPAKQGGRNVPQKVVIPVVFKLEGGY